MDDTLPRRVLDRIEAIIQSSPDKPEEACLRITALMMRYHRQLAQDRLVAERGWRVQEGPFAGMKYVRDSAGSVFLPKLLGCYESELHGLLRALEADRYERVIDIGCGEGYYAVGFARLWPRVRVHAFDIDAGARALCQRMAKLNRVAGRVTILGACTHAELRELAGAGALIFCDCEGSELRLLDLARVPGLAQADLLVECHDFLNPKISARLQERFRKTHAITVIPTRGSCVFEMPILRPLLHVQRFAATWESRPWQTPWLFLRAEGRLHPAPDS